MNSPKTWHDLIPTTSLENDKENLLLRHIMDFHIHPVDNPIDGPEPISPISETSSQEYNTLETIPRSKSWRRLSEGSIFLTNKSFPTVPHFQDVPQPQPVNRIWLQGTKPDRDITVINYPVQSPVGRVLNMENAFSRGRPRFPDRKAMQRLNISPVRTDADRKSIAKLCIPSKIHRVRTAGHGNHRLSNEMVKIESSPLNSQSSGYVDLSEMKIQRSEKNKNRDPRLVKDALVGNTNNTSYSQTSSERSNIPMNGMSIVTISADTDVRKVICAPEVLCEHKKIATKHLKNCFVTYVPEDGRRIITNPYDNVSHSDAQNKEMSKRTGSKESHYLGIDSNFAAGNQSIQPNKTLQETETGDSGVDLDNSNQTRLTPKFISKKGTLNTQRGPIKSLTSRAIPIDSPDLNPSGATATPKISNPQPRRKLIRRKEPFRPRSSMSSSYAPSFPDSTIMAHIERAGIVHGNLKFSRIGTNQQKSYVTDPAKDFRKEVKRMMETSQGYHLKPRMVIAPSGHPKIIACHIPNTPSTSHAAVRYVGNRSRSKQIEPATLGMRKSKKYAAVFPNVQYRYSGFESPPIYVTNSPRAYKRNSHNEAYV